MEVASSCYENLKTILKNIRNPALLDDHPWTRSLIVQEGLARDPKFGLAGPGHQLVQAIDGLFSDMQPSTPPRRGKRLDPRWGEFGLLAALYFTPFRQGTAFPRSLMDAWRRIDPAILYHVYGRPAAMLSREEVEKFQLVGEEVEYGSTSTLSDWHRKGVQRLAEIMINRERYLSRAASEPPTIVDGMEGPSTSSRAARRSRRFLWAVAALVVVLLLVAGVFKGRQLDRAGRAVVEDVSALQLSGETALHMENLEGVYPQLLTLKTDLDSLQKEVEPLLWLSPGLAWLPTYGGDLSAAPELLQMAGHLVNAADLGYQASRPLLDGLASQGSDLDPASLTALLVAAQPQLAQARVELDQSMEARSRIDTARLSPRLRELIAGRVDPILERADEGLSLAASLPVVLGASGEGPKTYLLLVQNEDELRATGGFITAVGRLVVHDGQVISLEFEQVDNQEDWTKPYPSAPWQMREFMNSRVILLRDANWSPDFPTSAGLAETLYAYNHSLSADGVIAFDQQFLILLLRQLGPLQVEGASEPVTADNVIPYMRSAKKLPAGEPVPAGWHRKEFMTRITAALLTELVAGEGHDWRGLAGTLSRAIEERHLLLQFDNPQVTALLAGMGWDNALHAGTGDFLMVTDTNMGFNKTDAVVERGLSYTVDLTDLADPRAGLTVSHANHADPNVPCIHWNNGQLTGETSYPVDRCYWSYLRTYRPAGTRLLDATPMTVPGDWMILGREIPARVDSLEENLPGIEGFGTFLVVPGGRSLDSQFLFALPAGVLSTDAQTGAILYSLKVQKQPGTLAVPIHIEILLPEGAKIGSAPGGAISRGNALLISTTLQTDVELQVTFSLE